MVSSVTSGKITLTDTVPGSMSISKTGKNEWLLEQSLFEEVSDHNQNAAWVEIRNDGPEVGLRVHIKWAVFLHANYRRCGYQQKRGRYSVVSGTVTPETTIYDIRVPRGTSYFGALPWYDLKRADKFFSRMERHKQVCRVRSVGQTADGRDIKCLTIETPSKERKRNVVMMARVHANETAGSWALEATADYILSGQAAGRLLKKYAFHIFPAVNPDGVAHGIKFTRPGPNARRNLEYAGMSSDDPTIVAVRNEVLRLKPHTLIDHHGYLFSVPMLCTYEKKLGLQLLDALIGPNESAQWYFQVWAGNLTLHSDQIRYQCHRRYGTQVVITELPWSGRLPEQIEALGVKLFQAVEKVILV